MFANKQDLPNALSVSELTDKLGLHALRNKTVSNEHRSIFPTSAVKIKLRAAIIFSVFPDMISCPHSGTLSLLAPPRALGCMRDLTGYPKSFPRTNEGHTRKRERERLNITGQQRRHRHSNPETFGLPAPMFTERTRLADNLIIINGKFFIIPSFIISTSTLLSSNVVFIFLLFFHNLLNGNEV